MKLSKYDYQDLLAIVQGDMTIEEVADKYNTDVKTIQRQCNRRGIHLTKRRVRVTRAWKYVTEVTEYDSVYQCALALKVDSATIRRAINGEKGKKLARYQIEYIEQEEYVDEQIGERYTVTK